MTNVVEYFALGGHEAVTRRQPVRASQRGYYLIEEAGIVLPDFFAEGVRTMYTGQAASLLVCPKMIDSEEVIDLSRQIVGEIVSRNRLYQDVFSFRGIREYTCEDPLSAVNWKASARAGEYMVNIRDYTSGQHVRFLLDLEQPSIRYTGGRVCQKTDPRHPRFQRERRGHGQGSRDGIGQLRAAPWRDRRSACQDQPVHEAAAVP